VQHYPLSASKEQTAPQIQKNIHALSRGPKQCLKHYQNFTNVKLK